MLMRPLGRSGLQVSAISFGAMNFGLNVDEQTAERMLLSALDGGINLIDTADIYSAGESERMIGAALRRSGRRDEAIIATKCGMKAGPNANDAGASRRHIVRSCEASLRRLDTDRIDLFQLHRPTFDTALEETLGALDQLVRSGKVLAIGSSTFPAWFLAESLAVSERNGWPGYISQQSPYNLLDRRVEDELVPLAQRRGVAILPWSPLAAGILAGRYGSTSEIPADSRAAILEALRDRVTERGLEVAGEVARLGGEAGLAPGQLALLWLRDQPGVTSPIVGPRTPEQLAASLAIADHPPLETALLARLDELVPPGQTVSDFHNTSRWTGGIARL